MKSGRGRGKNNVGDTGAACDALETLYRAESEKSFQARVVRAAEQLGWLVSHQWLSIHSAAGVPDLMLVRGNRLLFLECKREHGGRVTDRQQVWIDALNATGAAARVVRPSDWDDIIALLR